MISYATESNEYQLTGRTFLYNDIITYKKAVAEADFFPNGLRIVSSSQKVTDYHVGYKKKMDLEGVNINFYNILHLPFMQIPYFEIKISADKDLDGKLIIRVNGLTVDTIHAPLIKDKAGLINWELK